MQKHRLSSGAAGSGSEKAGRCRMRQKQLSEAQQVCFCRMHSRQLSGFPESAGCEANKRFSCMVHGRRIHLLPCALLTFRYPVRIADNKSIILQTSAPRNQSCFRAGRQIPHPAHRTLSQTGRSDRFLLLRTPTSAAPVLLPK